jgi:DNA-binding SARP family transcriptional activator/TolB-like protein/tetratricopeptide (TPR) repeat protein
VFILLVLGGALVQGDAGALTGRAAHKRRLALLALLASSSTPMVSRDRITAFLWPDSDTEKARHLLSESLYVLRKELGDDAFVAVGDEIGLNPQVVDSDVRRFSAAMADGRLECASGLYAGPFLDGFYVSGAPEFERWAEGERDRLARACAGALERLARGREEEGRPAEAVEWWRRLAAHEPYSPRVALCLMRALDTAGERVAAIQHAAIHATLLREDLGLDPDGEVAALAERLRSPAAVRPTPPPSPPAGGEPGPATLVESPAPAIADVRPDTRAAGVGGAVQSRRLWGWAFAAALVGIGAAGGGTLLMGTHTRYDPAHVAVLYFEDNSPGNDQQYLANGISEELIRRLGEVEALDVVSANGVRPFRGRPVPPDSIRNELKVGTVVEGSIMRAGNRLRVSVSLVDPATQRVLRSRTLERPVDDLLALQDQLAGEVASFLRRRIGAEVRLRGWQAGTRSVVATEFMMRALEMRDNALESAADSDSVSFVTARRELELADGLLAQAAGMDRRWADPLVARGRLALDQARVAPIADRPAWLRRALSYAHEALRLRPGYPPALEVRGTAVWKETYIDPSMRGDTSRQRAAESDLQAAVRGDPSLASAWSTLSELLRFKEDATGAELASLQALEHDAFLANADEVIERLYRIYLHRGNTSRAREWCARGRAEFPADMRFLDCNLIILSYPASRPNPREAWRLLAELERVDPPQKARRAGRAYNPIFRRMRVAIVVARAGDKRRAREMLSHARRDVAEAARNEPEVALSFLYDEACLQLTMGDSAAALGSLEAYLRVRPTLRTYARQDPQLRPLWNRL